MTVATGRIRGRRSKVCPVVLFLALAGCYDAPPPPPTPPERLVPTSVITGNIESVNPEWEKDAFYAAYEPYMSRESWTDYFQTPPAERFDRYGLKLLDFQLREDLLRENELTREQVDAYRKLPSAEACRRFLADLQKREVKSAPPPH
jgi:hypothetical protein